VFPRLAPASRDCRGFLFVQKPRQLGDVRRNPPRLVTAEQLGSRSPSRFLTAEPALRRLVMILQRDHQAFHGTQGAERDHYDQRQPQRRVNPIGRMEQDLCDQGGADDDRAGEKHDEHGRPVSGIGKCVIKTAMLTMRPQRQKALEQLALAATRTRTR
jgi:hypothetical protein